MEKNNTLIDQARRSFFGKVAAAAGVAVAPGVVLFQVAQAKPAAMAVTLGYAD